MKNKVVVFTQNNARILINPDRIDRFEDKPNAFINPDLTFVAGVEPHFWKIIPNNRPMTLDEARRLHFELLKVIDDNEGNETHGVAFYKALLFILNQEIEACSKATDLVSKLIKKANGIEKEDLVTHLYDSLMVHSKEPDKRKDNQLFKELIEKWKSCTIIPMDTEERGERTSHVKRNGADNSIEQVKRRFTLSNTMYYTIMILTALVLTLVVLSVKK